MTMVLAKHCNAQISAQKVRIVADLVRGLDVNRAMDILNYCPKKAAQLIKKVLNSAIANAEHNNGLDIDELKIKYIYINEAHRLKRWHARAKGRGDRITKRSCHINVVVSDKNDEK